MRTRTLALGAGALAAALAIPTLSMAPAQAMGSPEVSASIYTTPGSGCSMIGSAQSYDHSSPMPPGKLRTVSLKKTQTVGSNTDPVDRVTIASKARVTGKLTTKHKAFSALRLTSTVSVSMDATLGFDGTSCEGIDTDLGGTAGGTVKIKGKGTFVLTATNSGSPGSAAYLQVISPDGVVSSSVAAANGTTTLRVPTTKSGTYIVLCSGALDLQIGSRSSATSSVTATGRFIKAGK